MCVEIDFSVPKKTIRAFKIFKADKHGHLFPLCRGSNRILVDKRLVSGSGPGYQAFVCKAAAEEVAKTWWNVATSMRLVVREVVMYKARTGVIDCMSACANGHLGIIADRMRVLPLRQGKK